MSQFTGWTWLAVWVYRCDDIGDDSMRRYIYGGSQRALLNSHASGRDRSLTDTLSLSRRTELAADAFTAIGIVRLMNRISSKRVNTARPELSVLSNGIELTVRLQRGDTYLAQGRSLLIPPESAEIVEAMRAFGTDNIAQQTQVIQDFLERIRALLIEGQFADLNKLDPGLVESTRVFFRMVHTSIADQLGLPEPPLSPADAD
jgi:hypothetical protein